MRACIRHAARRGFTEDAFAEALESHDGHVGGRFVFLAGQEWGSYRCSVTARRPLELRVGASFRADQADDFIGLRDGNGRQTRGWAPGFEGLGALVQQRGVKR
jgi:hypothetical protein